jgi:uncharacterized protein (DUF302 family)
MKKRRLAVTPPVAGLAFILGLSFFIAVFFPANSFATKIPKGPFYIVKVKKSFKSALFDLKQGIEDANYSILAIAPISTGIKGIGYKIPDLKVIDFCKLMDGYKLLKYNMNYAAFMPCRIAIYKEGKYTVMISFLPSYFSRFFKNNAEQKKTIIAVTKQIIQIMDSVKTGF